MAEPATRPRSQTPVLLDSFKRRADHNLLPGIGGLSPNAESHTEVGWTAGGGVEYAVTNAVSLKAEYLHVDLGSQTFKLVAQQPQLAPSTGNGFITAKYENDYDIVRVGVNVKFDRL